MVVGLLAFVNLYLLIGYIFIDYRAIFHSDSAAKVLLAREIFDTGAYFPPEWNYVNGDLFVVFGHAFILPLLNFIPAGFTSHAISGAVSTIILLIGIWLLTGVSGLGLWRRVAILSIFAAGISGFVAENLYGQVSYGVVVGFCCYLMYFFIKFCVSNRHLLFWGVGFVVIVFFAYWSNPRSAMVFYGIPFIGGVVWLLLTEGRGARRRFFLVILFFLLSAFVGGVVHYVTLAHVLNAQGAGNALWISYELMLRNLKMMPKGIMAIFGGLPNAGDDVITGYGIYGATRLATALGAILLIIIAIVHGIGHGQFGIKMVSMFTAISASLVLLLLVSTSIPDMKEPILSARYLVPSVILGLIVLFASQFHYNLRPLFSGGAVFVMLVLATAAYPTYRFSYLQSELHWDQPARHDARNDRVIEFLLADGLRYGYATFWNAGVYSVLSEEKVLVRQIFIDKGMPIPMRHLSSNRWYRPAAWDGRVFLLLTEEESSRIDWMRLQELGLTVEKKAQIEDFNVFIFSENIAKKIPGWDPEYRAPFEFLVLSNSNRQVGRIVSAADGRYQLVAEKGEVGALHFGPYVNMWPGRYKVTFDVISEFYPEGALRLDVVANGGTEKYAERTLSSSDGRQTLEFALKAESSMEFRVWSLGKGRVSFRGVVVERDGGGR